MWRSLAWRQGDSFRLALKPPKVAATLLDKEKERSFQPDAGGTLSSKGGNSPRPSFSAACNTLHLPLLLLLPL